MTRTCESAGAARWALALVAAATVSLCSIVAHTFAASLDAGPRFVALGERGDLHEALTLAAGASLPDGDVLVMGGVPYGPTGSASAFTARSEVFDSARQTFRLLPSRASTPRTLFIAAALPGGRVLIAGGSGSSFARTAEVLDVATQRFRPLPARLLTPETGAAAAPVGDGDVLIAGGSNSTSPALRSAELFNPAAGRFRTVPSQMRIGRFDAVAASLPDRDVLIAGGLNGRGVVASAEIFSPRTGQFRLLRSRLAIGVWNAMAATLSDGDVLIAGGFVTRTNPTPTERAELFDPRTETFTLLRAHLQIPTAAGVGAPLPGGRALVTGGETTGDKPLRATEVFIP